MNITRVRGDRAADRKPRAPVRFARRPRPSVPSDIRHRAIRRWGEGAHPDVIPIGETERGEIATVAGLVERLWIDPAEKRIRALIRDATGEIVASWPAHQRGDLMPGRGVVVRGRLRRTPRAEMLNPRLVLMPDEESVSA